MSRSDETYIVRVRAAEGDAVVEDVRTQERSHARDLSELGALIARLFERARARRDNSRESSSESEAGETRRQ